jgi:hypothetical protein
MTMVMVYMSMNMNMDEDVWYGNGHTSMDGMTHGMEMR